MRIRAALFALLALCGAAHAQSNSGGFPFSANSLAIVPVAVKLSQGVLLTVNCGNPNAAISYLQFFDTTSTVVPGTTVPKFSLPVPASTSYSFGIDANFLNGIQVIAATTPTGGSAPGSALNCAFTFR